MIGNYLLHTLFQMDQFSKMSQSLFHLVLQEMGLKH